MCLAHTHITRHFGNFVISRDVVCRERWKDRARLKACALSRLSPPSSFFLFLFFFSLLLIHTFIPPHSQPFFFLPLPLLFRVQVHLFTLSLSLSFSLILFVSQCHRFFQQQPCRLQARLKCKQATDLTSPQTRLTWYLYSQYLTPLVLAILY